MGLAWRNWKLRRFQIMRKMVVYKVNYAKKNDIYHHLIECSRLFIPPLSSNVHIEDYTQKIVEKADTFEAWSKGKLIGLIAAYCNNFDDREAYITSVSVIESFSGMGIASELLSICITHVENIKFNWIKLKVNKNSKKARNLYHKYDFQEIDSEDDFVLMRRKVKDE